MAAHTPGRDSRGRAVRPHRCRARGYLVLLGQSWRAPAGGPEPTRADVAHRIAPYPDQPAATGNVGPNLCSLRSARWDRPTGTLHYGFMRATGSCGPSTCRTVRGCSLARSPRTAVCGCPGPRWFRRPPDSGGGRAAAVRWQPGHPPDRAEFHSGSPHGDRANLPLERIRSRRWPACRRVLLRSGDQPGNRAGGIAGAHGAAARPVRGAGSVPRRPTTDRPGTGRRAPTRP